ncbi:TetR/AcrR family transcriptional regulator [Kitasatospora aureofaciens]|uniref:TetR/AcrR family transcriptional regulator n=1 Tax=Kitasatospora aureofaciens TaxID=1894 RepID=UPI000524E0E5|nr:TetR/AcrR family transcriptional regulator [Kitasatospora aureofaciens]HJD84508.1 TetR/AcrR family transcriptional regulator [Kitasatospora aureofaciens]
MQDLVKAALAAAKERGQDVADVPLTAIATAAGISRSTLLRRLGGSRAALDEAVRQTGVDPGGRPPVRERAIEAAARLVAERGLGAITLDAVADRAECSLPSLHAVFEGRDGLLAAVFLQYGPLPNLEALAADPPERLDDTVRALHHTFLASLADEPRIVPAVFADLLSRPDGPAARMMTVHMPRIVEGLGRLLLPHVESGRIRPLPLPVLVQLLLGPLLSRVLMRPVLETTLGAGLPSLDESIDLFTEAYLRAVALPAPDESTSGGEL